MARALVLSEVEREYLFLLAQNRPPQRQYQPETCISPRLQRLLDAMESIPAFVKTSDWTIVAWNRAATLVLADYAEMSVEGRNIMRMIFCDPEKRRVMPEWEKVASFVVSTFRAESARAGMTDSAKALIEELSAVSPEFRTRWLDQNVSNHGEGTKKVDHAEVGIINLDYSSFAVDGHSNLSMVVYNPVTEADKANVRALLRLNAAAGFAV